jgi:hypothetical protein
MQQLSPKAEQLFKALVQALSEDDQPEQAHAYRYLIVDQSAYPRLKEIQSWLYPLPVIDVLTLKRDEWSGASPLLIEVGSMQESQSIFRLFAWLAEQGVYACGLQWLATPDPIDIAATRLEKRTHALAKDGSDYVLRWFDGRVMTGLQRALGVEHHAALLGCANDWRYVDRRGDLISLPCQQYKAHDGSEPPFVLSEKEELDLIDLGTVDAILDILQTNSPSDVQTLDPCARYEWAAPLVKQAQKTGIQSLPEIAAFCLLARQLGDDFATHDPWRERLERVRLGVINFGEALNES